MSPASRSKSKEKKASKDLLKASSKTSGHVNSGGGISTSGYNPVLGTFHTIETAPIQSAATLHNGRFRNIDDTDDPTGNSFGPGIEYDSVSNNGSWSGESEDHKERISHPPSRQEAVPGADNDRREKKRQKNEKKHQRQKERRAQELHDRCSGYLMSRKLEALAQQLVAMGFPHERATMALILNEGRVEESVSWLFEGGEEADKHAEHKLGNGGNLKIDITEELARVADLERRYKCSKQEVERAVVACEGDLEKAEESLRTQRQEPPAAPPKPEETGDPPIVGNGKLPVAVSQNSTRTQSKPTSITIQQRRDEKDFNYTKVPTTAGSPVDPKNMQSLKRLQPKMERAKQLPIAAPAEKRWTGAGSNPSVSYSLASPLQASQPSKTEARFVSVGNELKKLQIGSVREPVMMMQRPQSTDVKHTPSSNISSSLPGTVAGWHPNNGETLKPNGMLPFVPGSRSLSTNAISTNQMYNQLHYQQQQQQQQLVSSSGSFESSVPSRSNGLWRTGSPSTLAAASSLGLFSGLGAPGSTGSASNVDWSTGGSMLQLDYANIDWSLDHGSSVSRPSGLWPGMNSVMQNGTYPYDSFTSGLGVKTAMRPVLPNGSSVSIAGLQDGVAAESSGGSREWTSPFEEREIFSLPRQFVSPPSL